MWERINISYVDIDCKLTTTSYKLNEDIQYVEQLTFEFVESKGVGSIYRIIFGLKLIDKNLWLAPNISLEELFKLLEDKEELNLHLSIRFIPSCLNIMRSLDNMAFELLFAQTKYDFLFTKFNQVKKSHMLWNDLLLGLIATDLVMYIKEHHIDPRYVYNYIQNNNFVPNKAPKWQGYLLLYLRKHLQLEDTVIDLVHNCPKELGSLKQAYIEHFTRDVSENYSTETYNVRETRPINKKMKIRIRYVQTHDNSECFLEIKQAKKRIDWNIIDTRIDIRKICYTALTPSDGSIVDINYSSNSPYIITFPSYLHAKSFLSGLDGYYRLIRRWHAINFCRQIVSPDLEFLNRNKIHGPIGFETAKGKLSNKIRESGTFLIRRCNDNSNTYYIDVLLKPKVILEIKLCWFKDDRTYRIDKHIVDSKKVKVDIKCVNQNEGYKDIKSLVSDIEIEITNHNNNNNKAKQEEIEKIKEPPLQLRYWVPPNEYDDYPLLLLCISKKTFKEMCDMKNNDYLKSLGELPKFIPLNFLQIKTTLGNPHDNGIVVKQAVLTVNGEHKVIIKECSKEKNEKSLFIILAAVPKSNRLDFHLRYPADQRLIDWPFVDNPLFAKTIGLANDGLSKNRLVQEYLETRLDTFLSTNKEILTKKMLLSVCHQLAHALLYLQEKRIIHGKIRCHNIFVESYDIKSNIKIKLTDPLGTFDEHNDSAFLSPEYEPLENKQLLIGEYTPIIDIWAFGTTLWQIYSIGLRPPPGKTARLLTKPDICSEEIWQVAESCWFGSKTERATPQTLYRDLNISYDWDDEASIFHSYEHVEIENTSQPKLKNHDINNNIVVQNKNNCPLSCDYVYGSSSSSEYTLDTSRNDSTTPDRGTRLLLSNKSNGQYHKNDENNLSLFGKLSGTLANVRKFFNRNVESNLGYNNDIHCSIIRNNINSYHKLDETRKSIPSSVSSYQTNSVTTKTTDIGDSSESIHELDEDSDFQIDPNDLKDGIEIGKGTNGIVKKGLLTCKGSKPTTVAIKIVNKGSTSPSMIENLKREFKILKKLNNDFIVKTLGYVAGPDFKVVVEYMPQGSLLCYLREAHHYLMRILPLQKYASDIANGMRYLESRNIIHRDLALRNVLVKDARQVKICDFGLAQRLDSTDHYKVKTDRALPVAWYAPEALHPNWEFSIKSDVWSYGIVLWEIYSFGCQPKYPGDTKNLKVTLRHERLLKPKACSEEMYNLMRLCWAYNPGDRLSFVEICDKLDHMK